MVTNHQQPHVREILIEDYVVSKYRLKWFEVASNGLNWLEAV
jgi:hypothetical protein